MRKPLDWRFGSIEKKTRTLCHKVRRRMANRQKVTEYYPAEEQEEDHDAAVRPQDPDREGTWEGFSPEAEPIDPNDPPKVVIGKNALDGYNAVSYHSWLGPEDMRLREEPSKKQQQVLIEFPDGKQFFPLALVEASAADRYNWHETVVCFDKAASEAQVPRSIPEPYRASCIEKVRSCNPRLKPSLQECYENLDRSIKHKLPIHLADLVAMLCFVHYCVGETGRNNWLWKKLKAQRLLECFKHNFDWVNIEEGLVYSLKGRFKARKVTLEPVAGLSRGVKRCP